MANINNENLDGKDTYKEARKTLVCVTNQFECERIIKAGRIISDITHTSLETISVVNSAYPSNPEAIEYLYKITKEYKGIMNVEYSDTPLKTITKYIKQNKISNVLTGVPTSKDSIMFKLRKKFMDINFFIVEADGEIKEATDSCLSENI